MGAKIYTGWPFALAVIAQSGSPPFLFPGSRFYLPDSAMGAKFWLVGDEYRMPLRSLSLISSRYP